MNSASATGGWEALAVQMFYPDQYNGAFAACPDPVDFRAYTVIDIYKDKNAYFMEGAHKRIAQPAMHHYLGHVTATQQDVNYYELALGTNSRPGEQHDIYGKPSIHRWERTVIRRESSTR